MSRADETPPARMHPGQLDVDVATATALVCDQYPAFGDLPVRTVRSHGTVHALYRLGERLVLRFPIQPGDATATRAVLVAEADAARRLRGRLGVPTPEPVGLGEPGRGYPLPWAIYRWLPGTVATEADVGASWAFAADVADVVAALRRIGTGGRTFAGPGRGGLLLSQDDVVADCLAPSEGLIDTAGLRRLWAKLRATPRSTPDVMTHGDLMPGNLLVRSGRLAAVLDVGGLAPADSALDLMPAWNLLTGDARSEFRTLLQCTDDDWARGQGWALAQAIGCLSYYRRTNPVISAIAHRTLSALLADG